MEKEKQNDMRAGAPGKHAPGRLRFRNCEFPGMSIATACRVRIRNQAQVRFRNHEFSFVTAKHDFVTEKTDYVFVLVRFRNRQISAPPGFRARWILWVSRPVDL